MTKTIRYCDRCKKEIMPNEVWNNLISQERFPTFKVAMRSCLHDAIHDIDLCPSCSYDLNMLLKNFMEEKDDTPELKDSYNCMMEDNKNDS